MDMRCFIDKMLLFLMKIKDVQAIMGIPFQWFAIIHQLRSMRVRV